MTEEISNRDYQRISKPTEFTTIIKINPEYSKLVNPLSNFE